MTISKLGRYDIVRILGKGAMGLVYEARDPNLDRRVAIKTIKVENLSAEASADYEARFRTEARSAARLQHPNIVSVYDSERHGDVAYLVMEYVQGDDLKQRLDGGTRYSLEQSLAMVRDLLAALDYAHRQNIVHRDVKPANLLVEANGRVKLTDFGVARIQDSGEATRTKGSMVGTLKYMSPEQVQGLPVDARADLFAAGIVLYQLLTGKRPFDGDSEFAIIHQIVSQNPPPPSTLNPQLPAALDAVLARALAKQRAERFATAHDFSLALQEASGQATDPTIVPPFSAAEPRSASGTGSGALRSRGGGSASGPGAPGDGSGSTVTQELELVYWKDVKDSDDPSDLQGFMDRFPAGIYADLARRRLKKLKERERGENSATQTMTVALTRGTASPEATLVSPNEAPRVIATQASLAVPEPALPPAPDVAAGVPPPLRAAPAPNGPGEPVAAAVPRSRVPLIAALAVAVLAVAGIVFKMSSGGGAPSAEGLPASAASSAAPAVSQPAASQPTVLVPAPVASASAPVPASAPVRSPSAGVKPASRVASAPVENPAGKVQPAKPAMVEVAPATMPPVAKPAPAKPAPEPASPAGPEQACEGRVLLGFQSCLNEQCARPLFANHPLCVERRAAEKQLRARQGAERN